MELTGIPGQIASFVIIWTAFAAVLLGVWIIWEYILWQYMISGLLKRLKLYKIFIQFILHRREFKNWIKREYPDEPAPR